jgi:hypothetical protein
MATFAAASDAARAPAKERDEKLLGALLAAGAAALFVGTLFYARLPLPLGLPAWPDERGQAIVDALSTGSQKLWLAGSFSFLGDCLLVAACIALASVRKRRENGLESAGWALIAVSAALAMIFDSMTAVLFWPLAHDADPGLFLAFKTWFDFLFASADAPFGLGIIAVLWADGRSSSPLLPRPLAYLGFGVAAAAAASGLGYAMGLLHLPLVIGLTVTFGCLVLAALGVQITRGPRAAER